MDNSKKSTKNNKIKNYFEGNTLNLEKLISDFEDYVYIIIMNSGIKICQEDIEEIKLDVFIAIWKNQKKLDKEKEISPYISAITRNLILKKYRDIKKGKNKIENDINLELEDTINLESISINNDKLNILYDILKTMKRENQDIFFLYYYNGLKLSEISKKLGFSIPKIKAKLFKTRRRLKKGLEERGYYE